MISEENLIYDEETPTILKLSADNLDSDYSSKVEGDLCKAVNFFVTLSML